MGITNFGCDATYAINVKLCCKLCCWQISEFHQTVVKSSPQRKTCYNFAPETQQNCIIIHQSVKNSPTFWYKILTNISSPRFLYGAIDKWRHPLRGRGICQKMMLLHVKCSKMGDKAGREWSKISKIGWRHLWTAIKHWFL